MALRLFLFAFFVLSSACAFNRPQVEAGPVTDGNCTFDLGYQLGQQGTAYDNSCTRETESRFLDGYRIGRKMGWVEDEIATNDKNLRCTEKEKELRFSGTWSPIVISPGSDDKVAKELSDMGCSATIMNTIWGANEKIDGYLAKRVWLEEKRKRVEDLHNKIVWSPEKTSELIEEYQASGADPLDVNLKWKDFIQKKGGMDNLDGAERMLVWKEVYKKPEMDAKAQWGAIYGFGIGHARQGRFWKDGWKWAVIDSIVAGVGAYGFATDQRGLAVPVLFFGVPFSRAFQTWGVYQHNFDHGIDLENLRTRHGRQPFFLAWGTSW